MMLRSAVPGAVDVDVRGREERKRKRGKETVLCKAVVGEATASLGGLAGSSNGVWQSQGNSGGKSLSGGYRYKHPGLTALSYNDACSRVAFERACCFGSSSSRTLRSSTKRSALCRDAGSLRGGRTGGLTSSVALALPVHVHIGRARLTIVGRV